MTDIERTVYSCKTPERAADLLRFFEGKGLHPNLTPPEDLTSEHKRWRVDIDPAPLLPPDQHTPPAHSRHWKRPEYHQGYGHWFSEQRPDFERCCVEVWGTGRDSRPSQCAYKAATDPDYTGKPTRCLTHSRAKIAERKAASDAKYAAERARWGQADRDRKARDAALALIIQIADGHNDPRGAAQDLLIQFGLRKPKDETF